MCMMKNEQRPVQEIGLEERVIILGHRKVEKSGE